MNDIVKLYDKYFKGIKYDNSLIRALRAFRLKWTQKSPDYIRFLSSNLTGVYPIRFSSIDENEFFKIFNVNHVLLKRESDKLKDVNPSWNVSSNITYLSLIYLMHKFYKTKNKKLIHDGVTELFFIFSFKALGSMMYNFFKYNLDIATAKSVFEHFSNRFIIKKVGSWQKVIEYRSNDVLPLGIYGKKILKMSTLDATKFVAGIHGSYKSMLIYIFRVIKEVKDDGGSISSTTIISNNEDGDKLKDITDSPYEYVTYIESIIGHKNDFVDDELIWVVFSLSKNITESTIKDTLNYYSETYDSKEDTYIKDIVEKSMAYLRVNGVYNPKQNILEALTMLKGYWSSGNTEIRPIKEHFKMIAFSATKKKTDWLLGSLTISTIIYIYLRAIIKKK